MRKPCQFNHGEELQQLERLQNSFKGYFRLNDLKLKKKVSMSFFADRGCIDANLSKNNFIYLEDKGFGRT